MKKSIIKRFVSLVLAVVLVCVTYKETLAISSTLWQETSDLVALVGADYTRSAKSLSQTFQFTYRYLISNFNFIHVTNLIFSHHLLFQLYKN